MNFQTEINELLNIDLYHLDNLLPSLAGLSNGGDYEVNNARFSVDWTVEIEARSWGIKSVSISITDVEGSFDVLIFDNNGDEIRSESVTFDIFSQFKANTELIAFDKWNQLQINEIAIDFRDLTVRVS